MASTSTVRVTMLAFSLALPHGNVVFKAYLRIICKAVLGFVLASESCVFIFAKETDNKTSSVEPTTD